MKDHRGIFMKKKKQGRLFFSLAAVMAVPIFVLGIILVVMGQQSVTEGMTLEIRKSLTGIARQTADMYSIRRVYPVKVLSIRFLYRSVRSDEFGEIVHYQTSPYFLKDTLRLFCVKM